jgi:hypothetical protein
LRQISATLLHGCIGQGSRLLPRIRSLERIRDSRVKALTDLEFDLEAIKESVSPNVDGDVYDSTAGFWLISRHYPHIRTILSPDAIHHGPMRDSHDPEEEQINVVRKTISICSGPPHRSETLARNRPRVTRSAMPPREAQPLRLAPDM